MKPQRFAPLTAFAWGVDGHFEKKGMHMGGLSPQVAITIRTAVALLVRGAVSYPQWKSAAQAGSKSLRMMVLGGGVLFGTDQNAVPLHRYQGRSASQVMPIAFTSPRFGTMMAVSCGGEPLTAKTAVGTLLTILGIVVLTI